jgi:hypothetical protein
MTSDKADCARSYCITRLYISPAVQKCAQRRLKASTLVKTLRVGVTILGGIFSASTIAKMSSAVIL